MVLSFSMRYQRFVFLDSLKLLYWFKFFYQLSKFISLYDGAWYVLQFLPLRISTNFNFFYFVYFHLVEFFQWKNFFTLYFVNLFNTNIEYQYMVIEKKDKPLYLQERNFVIDTCKVQFNFLSYFSCEFIFFCAPKN